MIESKPTPRSASSVMPPRRKLYSLQRCRDPLGRLRSSATASQANANKARARPRRGASGRISMFGSDARAPSTTGAPRLSRRSPISPSSAPNSAPRSSRASRTRSPTPHERLNATPLRRGAITRVRLSPVTLRGACRTAPRAHARTRCAPSRGPRPSRARAEVSCRRRPRARGYSPHRDSTRRRWCTHRLTRPLVRQGASREF